MADDDTEMTIHILGRPVNIKGLGTIIVVIVLVLTGGMGWMLYDLSHAAADAVKEAMVLQQQTAVEHKAIMEAAMTIRENQGILKEGVKTVGESVKTQNWILLADQTEKADAKRRLSMPRELRDLGMRERN